MRLVEAEFRAMNSGIRRFFHDHVEFPLLRRLGLREARGKDVVEFGCGNGYGAELIRRLHPTNYVGLDLMPEQIALAEQRRLPGARFLVGDVSRVGLADDSADIVVIFGILHHVERWREALAECRRLLRDRGILVVEEPDTAFLAGWDRVFHWNHPEARFSVSGLEAELQSGGLRIEGRVRLPGLYGAFGARMSKPARI